MEERSICVLGVGGGGGRIVDRITALAPTGAVTAVVDTDTRALAHCTVKHRIAVGGVRTGGGGAGGDVDIGRLSIEDDRDALRPLLQEAKLVIVAAALGGGTGSGACTTLLNAAREQECRTLCVLTIPFGFEGPSRRATAEQALPDIQAAADAVVAVHNDRLFASVGEATVSEAFLRADEVLATAVRALWKLVTHRGYINLTLADLLATIRGANKPCAIAFGSGTGKTRAQKAVTGILDGPLTEHGELLAGARAALVSIVGGPDLAVQEVNDMMQALSARLHADCHLVMGAVVDESARNKVMMTLVFADQWSGAGRPAPLPAEPPAAGDTEQKDQKRSARTRKRKNAQGRLSFDEAARGRFKDVEPTMLDGEDLDIPTFVRRGIKFEKQEKG